MTQPEIATLATAAFNVCVLLCVCVAKVHLCACTIWRDALNPHLTKVKAGHGALKESNLMQLPADSPCLSLTNFWCVCECECECMIICESECIYCNYALLGQAAPFVSISLMCGKFSKIFSGIDLSNPTSLASLFVAIKPSMISPADS